MPRKFDVVKAMGSYTDAQGQEKTRWLKCGVIIENSESGKMSLKMESIPYGIPGDEGWFALMVPTPRQNVQPQAPVQNYGQPAAAIPAAAAPPAAPVPEGFTQSPGYGQSEPNF